MVRVTKAPDVRRRELIACAQRLFYAQGYERTSVNDIVAEAGVAKGTFYHYFASKTAVLEAMVDELVAQSETILTEIVADETLAAIPKWAKAVEAAVAWKAERRTDLIAMLHMLHREENIRLQHAMRTKSLRQTAPEIAKIIAQGVAEGVFTTDFVEESAELVLVIMQSFSDTLANILLHPQAHGDPGLTARRKLAAAQMAVERVVGAPPGSLPIMDDQSLANWFADS